METDFINPKGVQFWENKVAECDLPPTLNVEKQLVGLMDDDKISVLQDIYFEFRHRY